MQAERRIECEFTPLEIMPRCSAAGLRFNQIPAGFNPLRQRLRGECPARFRVVTTGISNGVSLLLGSLLDQFYHEFSNPIGFSVR